MNTTISPHQFYRLVDLYERVPSSTAKFLEDFNLRLAEKRIAIADDSSDLKSIFDRFMKETRNATKQRLQSDWATSEEQQDATEPFQNILGKNFLAVVTSIVGSIQTSFGNLQTLGQDLMPVPLALNRKRIRRNELDYFSPERMQQMTYELQANSEVLTKFGVSCMGLEDGRAELVMSLDNILSFLDSYYQELVQRHTAKGIPIVDNPLITDVAICIYENVDNHGEIQDGASPEEVSAYSIQKATLLIEATHSSLVGQFIRNPSSFLQYIKRNYQELWRSLGELQDRFQSLSKDVYKVFAPYSLQQPMKMEAMDKGFSILESLDPRHVSFKDSGKLMSPEERHSFNFWCGTIGGIVERLRNDESHPSELVQYVLKRKSELFDWHQNENSFFACRIGSGNQFRGIAPGALEVVPGDRPVVDIDEIIGGGFDEIRGFVDQVESSAKWHDLFVATSPSRTADKSNVLLIGPQGSGKTEVLRAVGADKRSLSIFAQGSDFNTCWMGEASKNPKRLFQAGLKLQRKTNKHVHFLIDEIDAILNNDRHNAGYINLTLEFQILMDGVVQYPSLSVWGTTNNAQRIPMPMIRRFSKVAIVGELDQADRVQLLKHFAGFMPTEGFTDDLWTDLSTKLEGATGDIIRKVVDSVWRETMTDFVTRHPVDAEVLTTLLNAKGKFDVKSFNGDRRKGFQRLLGKFVSISPQALSDSVDEALGNVAIIHEIDTAKTTYANAKKFLASITEKRA